MDNKKNIDWSLFSSQLIIEGTDDDGERLLKLFLADYVELTNEVVNASCPACLNNYIQKYKSLKYMKKVEESDYELQNEYNGIPLEFGSGITVTNDNITNEYGEILLKRFKKLGTEPEVIFTKFPAQKSASKAQTAAADKAKNTAAKTKETVTKPEVKETTPETGAKDLGETGETEGEPEGEPELSDAEFNAALGIDAVDAEIVTPNKNEIIDLGE